MIRKPKRAALRAIDPGLPLPAEAIRRWVPSTWTELDGIRLSVAEASVNDYIGMLLAELQNLNPDGTSERNTEITAELRKAYLDSRKLSGFDRAFIEAVIRKYARLRPATS
ncbi:MAG: hypothetical protein Q8K85_03620 [Hyphomicrobium sp.]|nr:hypothetical protein [Hyphomicrobium sp.]